MDESPLKLAGKSQPSATQLNADSATANDLTFSQALEPNNPEDTNIHVAAQRGDIQQIQRLLDQDPSLANARDDQNVTPLHWAAINAHLPACRLLLSYSADVDARGGDLEATPLQWAARNGYIYVIELLISHGADPNITDSQGYNTLHLVTHSSSVMPLLYLLHQPIPVDSRDAQGHTSLMWAAYQGDPLSVRLLLAHGAKVDAKDSTGLSPLHWAVVRGNRQCIRRLVEAGAEVGLKDGEGRTPRDMAVELKSLGAWKRALEEGGMDEYGVKKRTLLSERNTKIAIFVLPTIFLYLMFTTLAFFPWYTGIILAVAEFFGMHHIVTRVLLNGSTYTDSAVNQSPYFAGIIGGSILWVVYSWIGLVGKTESHAVAHLLFALSAGLCMYNFFRAITLDAGSCPKPESEAELKSIIEDLASEGRLNGNTFCVECMAKKPLRSKHCRICDRCVARHDHHCPWVWNCVGANNHRQFLLFVLTLVIGIITFDYLTYQYFSNVTPATSVSPSCPLPSDLCSTLTVDPFLFSVSLWATIQLSWTFILLASQLWQIARQMTTLEVTNLGRWGFMGGRGSGLTSAASTRPSSPSEEASLMGAQHTHHRHGSCAGCGSSFIMSVLGFDRFTKGKAARGLLHAKEAANPFDLGVIGNCKDFWTMGRELGVRYEELYEVPHEGFKHRKEEMRERERDMGGKSGRRWAMGLSLPFGGGARRGGYEPLSTQV